MTFKTSDTWVISLLLVVIYLTQSFNCTSKWCWTRSMANESKFTYNPINGGLNWGYCKDPEKQIKRNKYAITVVTSNVRSSGTQSKIKIQIFGTLGMSQLKEISNYEIETGTVISTTMIAKDVGEVNKVLIKIEGISGYRCSKVIVKTGLKENSFECLNKLEPCNPSGNPYGCQMELFPDGNTPYEITIRTSEDDDAGTISPILISLIGSKETSFPKMFSEYGMKKSAIKKKILRVNDIGEITGYELKITEIGQLKVSYLIIKNTHTQILKRFDLNNVHLRYPGKNSFKYIIGSGIPGTSLSDDAFSTSSNGMNALFDIAHKMNTMPAQMKTEELDDAETDQSLNEFKEKQDYPTNGNSINFGWNDGGVSLEDGEVFNINNPWGGVMSSIDKATILELDCAQPLFNPTGENLFGPDFANGKGNYVNILAKCPSNCHKVEGKVESLGLHPSSSPICLSAMADNAMSDYGGIISISVFPGVDSYGASSELASKGLISIIGKYFKSEKSYTVSKVDNPDLVEKDIRILNHLGEISSTGRLEIRVGGVWGTICAKGNDEYSAIRICQDLGYKYGQWESPMNESQASDFCRTFHDDDYCGSQNYKAHFMGIHCSPKDTSFTSCVKSLASALECGRSLDAIISCNNNDILNEGNTMPNFLVRLSQACEEKDETIGRLEISRRGNWYPVCEHLFNPEVAKTACRQMGYDEGAQYFQGTGRIFQRSKEDKTPFGAAEVFCTGKERKISDCKMKVENIYCLHDQDLLLKCRGKGDPTGASQYKNNHKPPTPGLGKLGMLKYKASCVTSGQHEVFRGDPGSVYLIHCPAHCKNRNAVVTGTGIFTPDSSVCKAAVHAGVIQDETGGLISMTKHFGQYKYYGSTKYGIASTESYGKWLSAFSVSSVNSGWKGMWKIFKAQIGGSYIEKSSNIKPSILSSSYRDTKAPQYFSFLETSSTISTPVFEWIESDTSHHFSDIEDTSVVIPHNTMRTLPRYTFLISLTMTDFFGGKSYIFSYSGCGGFNVYYTDEGLSFGDSCDKNKSVETSLMIGKNDKTLIHAYYAQKSLKVALFSQSTKIPYIRTFKIPLEIQVASTVALGRLAIANQDAFYGRIDFVQVYDHEIPYSHLPKILTSISSKPKTAQVVDIHKTIDNRDCVSPILDGPTPGMMGAPNPPKLAELDVIYDIPTGNTRTMTTEFNYSFIYGTYVKENIGETMSIELDCTTNLNDPRFSGGPGKMFRVKCPVCENIFGGVVYGTGIYNPFSAICKAANHAGVLDRKSSGYVNVELLVGFSYYNGSQGKNEVMSANYGRSNISFRVSKGTHPKKITCETTASDDPFQTEMFSQKIVVLCPERCASTRLRIYGSEVYTANSPICLAAIHWGAITNYGGEVKFAVDGSQSMFIGTKSFGIYSHDLPSYPRSFRFVGSSTEGYYDYKENFTGKITDRWKIFTHFKAQNPQSNHWQFKDITTDVNQIQGLQKIGTLNHEGNIFVQEPGQFASWAALKGVEWANGRIMADFMFLDNNECGFLFKLVDEENYYALLFNLNKTSNNISLVKKIQGSFSIIKQTLFQFILGKWYGLIIHIQNANAIIAIQSPWIREKKVIFIFQIEDLSRGTIGIGTNGNSNFYVTGIQVDRGKNLKQLINNRRTWNELLQSTTTRDRKKYCSMFRNMPAFNKCLQPESYCKYRCNEEIDEIENILNYACFKSCIHMVRYEGTYTKAVKSGMYKPQANHKVDFMKDGDSSYLPANIAEVRHVGRGIYKIKVRFRDTDDFEYIEEVLYPSDRIFPCGKKLIERRDCIDHSYG